MATDRAGGVEEAPDQDPGLGTAKDRGAMGDQEWDLVLVMTGQSSWSARPPLALASASFMGAGTGSPGFGFSAIIRTEFFPRFCQTGTSRVRARFFRHGTLLPPSVQQCHRSRLLDSRQRSDDPYCQCSNLLLPCPDPVTSRLDEDLESFQISLRA